MTIHIKLFAVLRERASMSELTLELRPGATVVEAATALAERFPDLASFLPRVAFAVNQHYVKADTALEEGDELAFIPPVSGG